MNLLFNENNLSLDLLENVRRLDISLSPSPTLPLSPPRLACHDYVLTAHTACVVFKGLLDLLDHKSLSTVKMEIAKYLHLCLYLSTTNTSTTMTTRNTTLETWILVSM